RVRLATAYPEVTEYQAELAMTWSSLGVMQSEGGKKQDAMRSFERTGEIYARLRKAHPDVPLYLARLANNDVNVAILQREAGKPTGARATLDRAASQLTEVCAREPKQAEYRFMLCNAHWERALTFDALARHRDAVAAWDQAVRLNDNPPQRLFLQA